MACEVKTFGKIRDFKKVQEYFGLEHDENWLNSINSAISPTGELIALGQGEKLAWLSSCWDNKSQETTYALSWCGELENPNQIITAMLCLPIYGRSASTGPEWTCVALGLSSGMVVFYTDAGIKIFSQSYHEDPVISIKAYSPPRHSESDSLMYIIYNQCVCIMKGIDIFPLLTTVRYNLNCTMGRSSSRNNMQNPLETADTIYFQKFKFARERDTIINDAVVIGSQRPRTYDHIVEQCLGCGYYAKVSDSPVQSSMVMGVGAEPYLGFYLAEEGYRTISLGEVAKDVIGMAYKNILGNLFGRSSEPVIEAQPPSPTKDVQMRTRSRFFDGKRDGFTIAVAPGGRLAAVADNLDRVMLIDAERTIVLRVWKGYRDAQCAFIPVKEKSLKGVRTHRRKALFLVIYAPRLGCLEIWALQNGPKVAAFTVSKSGQLAYNTHGILGVQPASKVKASVNCCLFLDPSDGSVKEIQVPFHYALSESNSKTSRDIHLLRRLRNFLRDGDHPLNTEDISKLAADFQTVEVRQQCLEMLKKNKQLRPHIFQAVINAFSSTISQDEDTSEEFLNFQILVENYKSLVDFYIAMQSPQAVPFDEHLELCDSDLVTINQLVLLLGNRGDSLLQNHDEAVQVGGKVTFQDNCKDDGDFVDYLSIFQMDIADQTPLQRSKSELYGYVGGKLFGAFFERGLDFEQLKSEADLAKIPSEDLLVLALYFWIEKPFVYQNCDEVIMDMSRLAAMVRTICEFAGDRVNDYSYGSISPWWQDVREMLLENPKSLGLLVAIVCKIVATDFRLNRKESSCEENSPNEDDEVWEQISHDQAQWGLLIGKLEDIAVLGAILECPLLSSEPVMPELPCVQPNCSLKSILSGGKGIVTDLTAQWLINARIHPSKIVEPKVKRKESDEIDTKEVNEKPPETDESKNASDTEADTKPSTNSTADNDDRVLEKLVLLRDHFPFSLESGVLLSLMSWQYMVHWSKNLKSLEYIQAALTCLENFKEEDLALKHGICCMLWNATLKYPLQATMKLIHKVGRLPKDKMCQQDLEMTAALVPDFLELSVVFLRHFSSSLDHEKRELKFEESLSEGQLPLQFIALQQHHAIKELLQLHYELCSVLHLIAFFQLKLHKPISTVFDAMSNKAFFTDINKELAYVLPPPDSVLQQQRENFLCDVITASMDLIREDLQQLFVLEQVQYMKQVNALADSWKLDKTGIRRQQVIEMYAHGYDAHAEALLYELGDDETTGRMLLEIAGRRLNIYANTSKSTYLKIASIGHQLLQYLDYLKEPSAGKDIQITASEPDEIDIAALTQLVTKTLKCLSRRETKYLHIVAQMFDACSLLQD